MQIDYDKQADALYIRLLPGEHQCRVVRLTDDVALDFAEGEKLVGIEVLGARQPPQGNASAGLATESTT